MLKLDSNQDESPSPFDTPQPCQELKFSEIQLATQNFDESLVIGHGGFGKVYKGTITVGTSLLTVAIKRLESTSNQGAAEFWAEVRMLSKLRHCHLVSLIGYCNDGQELILVYDYMPRGTLEDHLHKRLSSLPWVRRLKICIGAARGLDYLHTGTGNNLGVIHRDVKSSNILLDDNWEAKISDFGLSKICPKNMQSSHVNTNVKGTFGYLDPDYFYSGKLTRKSDVYAFGVVLFELLCGKQAVDNSLDEEQWSLAIWAQDSIKKGRLNQIIDFNISEELAPKCLKPFAQLAKRCLHKHPKERPAMAEVVVALESVLALQEQNNNTPKSTFMWIFGRKEPMVLIASNVENSEIVSEKIIDSNSGLHIHSRSVVIENTNNSNGNDGAEEEVENGVDQIVERSTRSERRRSKPNPRLSNPPRNIHGEQVAAGWPAWLSAVAGEAINGWTPRRADTFEKVANIGQGRFSTVYKARDTITGKVVALKKVRFDNLEPESVQFMAREILILRRLNHPNVMKLEGVVTSRMSCSLYLVFEYMEHDLAGLAASPTIKFTEPQVKCYMHQLLSGLEHCHNRHVLHRDIKGSDLLLDNSGMLKIADFGLASFFDPNRSQPMTSKVVTLWYRPPELILGATDYGVGIDLWSAGCILAELLAGKPIMCGRTEVEQLHKIFKLCGSPSDEYWKKSKLPHATIFKPQESYPRCIKEKFKDFPPSSLPTIDTLLAIDPAERLTATAALGSPFFTTKPYACDPSSLPKYPPSKEMDAKLRDEEARRLRAAGKSNADGVKKTCTRDRSVKAIPAPEANAELQTNLDRRR